MRNTVLTIQNAKTSGTPLVSLTAYTAPMAQIMDAHCDMLLVGDSVAMVVYGHDSTLKADMDMMCRHGEAVVRATQKAMVVVDMPFGTYQASKEEAFTNAARILRETGATAVKLEGGTELADTVRYLVERGVPVVGHVGLQPQSFNALGGYKAQGRDEDGARKIMDDAKAIDQSGAFAIVIEGVAEPLAAAITKEVSCPTIGIGASAACDGQILVTEDMLGITQGKKPKFVKEYAAAGKLMEEAIKTYANEVRARSFPDGAYTYSAKASSVAASQTPETAQEEKQSPELNSFAQSILRAIPRGNR